MTYLKKYINNKRTIFSNNFPHIMLYTKYIKFNLWSVVQLIFFRYMNAADLIFQRYILMVIFNLKVENIIEN